MFPKQNITLEAVLDQLEIVEAGLQQKLSCLKISLPNTITLLKIKPYHPRRKITLTSIQSSNLLQRIIYQKIHLKDFRESVQTGQAALLQQLLTKG